MDVTQAQALAGDRAPFRHAWARGLALLASMLLAVVLLGGALPPAPVRAQGLEAAQLLHLPMRWCVLEGTNAARRNPDAAVLERIRRGTSILAAQAGITLRSALNGSLAGARAFPVIRDPVPRLGRLGDVRVPTESSSEYTRVMQTCAQAWQRLARQAGGDLGGVADGPTAVIIRDFVDGAGGRVGSVWGYAFSVSSNTDYCAADQALIRRASGGSLMVVDSSDGEPSAVLDRRLIAHEVGHILRLGHGDGVDNPGSARGRIDKFCDDAENPDIEPGSLMSRSLRYEDVRSWQRRLPRNVIRAHPAAMVEPIAYAPPVKRTRHAFLERLANGGQRVRRRLLPPGGGALRPLPRMRSAGVRGASFWDDLGELSRGARPPRGADLRGASVSADDLGFGEDVPDDATLEGEEPSLEPSLEPSAVPSLEPSAVPSLEPSLDPGVVTPLDPMPFDEGGFDITLWPDHLPFGAGEQFGVVVIDADEDPATGGQAGEVPDNPAPAWAGIGGIELMLRTALVEGELSVTGWYWDGAAGGWRIMDPPPQVEVSQRLELSEGEDEGPRGDTVSRRDSVVVSVPGGLVKLSQRFGMAAMLQLRTADGTWHSDSFPADATEDGLYAMSLAQAEYPLCALGRNGSASSILQPGSAATLELSGFGQTGTVDVWLGDRRAPIARDVHYQELGCALPWVTQVTLPDDVEPGLQVLQVVLGGTGLTAECAVIVGDGELPDFDAP